MVQRSNPARAMISLMRRHPTPLCFQFAAAGRDLVGRQLVIMCWYFEWHLSFTIQSEKSDRRSEFAYHVT